MATTLEQLTGLLDACGKKYTAIGEPNAVVLPLETDGEALAVLIRLHSGGELIQLRSSAALFIEDSHPKLEAAARLMLELNAENRFVKMCRDPSDGEVMARGDVWLEDAQLTQAQLDRTVDCFFSLLAEAKKRLAATLN